MKRVLSAFLCVCMLLTAVSLLSSCKKDEVGEKLPTVSKKTVEIDLNGYSVIYPSTVSTESQTTLRNWAKGLKSLIGVSLAAVKEGSSSNAKGEILVGALDRAETQKALKGIKGDGYTIQVVEGTIVIVGTNQLFTNMALQYFTDNYLKGGKSVITINQKIELEKAPTVTIATNEGSDYAFVYNSYVDTDPKDHQEKSSDKAAVDYPCTVNSLLATELNKTVGVNKKDLVSKTDKEEATAQEIYLGFVERDDCRSMLAEVSANQYGLIVRGGKVQVAAWNDEALEKATSVFKRALKDALVEDEDGNKSVVFPAYYTEIYDMEVAWEVDFPKPEGEGIDIVGTLNVEDGSLEYAYQGSGVTQDAYESYCKLLADEGYELVTENKIEGSYFKTYKNTETDVMLHVVFAAYKHAETQGLSDQFKPTIRIVSAALSQTDLPSDKWLNPNAISLSEKICDPMVTQLQIDPDLLLEKKESNVGMSYVITLEDGSFILFDGGGTGQKGNAGDGKQEEYIWKVLNDLYVKAHGYEPTEGEPIHIRAWILTHEHIDHYGAMDRFLRKYGKEKTFRLEALLANFASDYEGYNAVDPLHVIRNNLQTLQGYVTGGFKYIKLHTGQKFYIQNAELEVLFTHEDFLPHRLNFYNDTSNVVRITLHTRDEATGEVVDSKKTMWLGDVAVFGANTMRAMYGEYLKSDTVQVSHHGYYGCDIKLYDIVAAPIVFWPVFLEEWRGLINLSLNGSESMVQYVMKTTNRYLAQEAEYVKYIIVAATYGTTLILHEGLDLTEPLDPTVDLYDVCGQKQIVFGDNGVVPVDYLRK